MNTEISTEPDGFHRCPWWMQYVLVSPLRRILEPAAKLLGPHIEPGMTVVEPGCGFGYLSIPMARMVGPEGRVISLDVEPRAVERLQRRADRAGLADRIQARTCQSRDLGLAEHAGKVDRVVVIHTLHEFEDLPGYLAQFKTLLEPNGRLYVVEPRGHVSDAKFAEMMITCGEAGFVEVERSTLGRRFTALFELARS